MYKDSFASGELPPGEQIGTQAFNGLRKFPLAALFSTAVSLALLVAVALEFRGLDAHRILALIPSNAAFWAVFAVWYLAGPVSEWIIYRRLWHIPAWGIGALLRKMVSNELLLGYLGEAQFYAWARARSQITAAPFGAIKDVTILSALTGNVTAAAMLVIAWPIVSSVKGGIGFQSTFLSLGVILVSSLVIFLLRRRLFSLPAADLRFITMLHLARIAAKALLGAFAWHLALPQVPVTLWLVLSTLRMLVSRLPLMPNKDVVFAGVAVFLLGDQVEAANLLAVMAGLVLLGHIGIGGAFAMADLWESWKQR